MEKDLKRYLAPVWAGNAVLNESALFVGEEGTVSLLYEPMGKIEIKDSRLQTVYKEGVDYSVNGKTIQRIREGNLPFFSLDEYYLAKKCVFDIRAVKGAYPEYNENRPFLVFGEKDTITKRQVAISYSHTDRWKGVVPIGKCERFSHLHHILESNKELKLTFYGDSITAGCNASGTDAGGNVSPFMSPFSVLIKKQLEEKFGKKIDYTNTAVGGWASWHGLNNFTERVLNREVDLLVLGFGMNDISSPVSNYKKNMEEMIAIFHNKNPESEILLLSSMLPNVETNWAVGNTSSVLDFEKILLDFEEKYSFISVANMTQMHMDLLNQGKRYRDMTGNNINHPNDFLIRIYAQVILKTLFDKNIFI